MHAEASQLHKLSDVEGQSYITVEQIQSRTFLQELFTLADEMERVKKDPVAHSLRSIALLFYQASTRTHGSFRAASQFLGARAIADYHGMNGTSVEKSESFEDTLKSVVAISDPQIVVLRHPDNDSSERAAQVLDRPVVNAGSGKAEHPTQALLDAYTIQKYLGQLENLHVVAVGDMLNGRTIKSLAKLLTLGKGNTVTFVAPENLSMPEDIVRQLDKKGVKIQQTTRLEDVLSTGDVFYWTRVQKEWFDSASEYEAVKDRFILTPDITAQMRQDAIIMHPLPRVNEIEREVDKDVRAVYFHQMENGLLVRMALLKTIAKPLMSDFR